MIWNESAPLHPCERRTGRSDDTPPAFVDPPRASRRASGSGDVHLVVMRDWPRSGQIRPEPTMR